jgi:hypothetical protein
MSSSPRASSGGSVAATPSRVSGASGSPRRTRSIHPCRTPVACSRRAAMVSRSSSAPVAPASRRRALALRSRISRASDSNILPAAVSSTCRRSRMNSGVPTLASSDLICCRQRRRGDVQPLCRTAEVKLLGDRHEIPEQPQLHAPNDTPSASRRLTPPRRLDGRPDRRSHGLPRRPDSIDHCFTALSIQRVGLTRATNAIWHRWREPGNRRGRYAPRRGSLCSVSSCASVTPRRAQPPGAPRSDPRAP